MQAIAKLNLYLAVTGRRSDGYHDLNTIFLPLPSLADSVVIDTASSPGIAITCDNPTLPTGADNLCWQAAERFCRQTGISPRINISLSKRIPIAAGLGGGSSDAAAVLLELRRQLVPELPDQVLHSLATSLGADVSFFLSPIPSLATGIGDVLSPIPVASPLPLVLLAPNFPISAAWAYQHWQSVPRPPAPPISDLLAALAQGDLPAVAQLTHNDLEYCALEKFPLLRLLRQRLLDLGCLAVHLTGSGPTLFGLAPASDLTSNDLASLTDGFPNLQAWFFPDVR